MKKMEYNTEALQAMIARDYVLNGGNLEDIAVLRDIPMDTLKKIARGQLFNKRVRKIQEDIDQQVASENAADPIHAFLQANRLKALRTLKGEMENFDKESSGATAATRIKAADSLLNRAGVVGTKEDTSGTTIIMISAEKAAGIAATQKELAEKLLEQVPDCVDGL